MTKKIKEKPPDGKQYFKCVKIPIKHIIKSDESLKKINDTVIKVNKIVVHCLQFMKLYLLDYFNRNKKLPTIDKPFVNTCLKLMCKEHVSGRPPSKQVKKLKTNLQKFFNKHYKPIMVNTNLDYTNLNTVLDYLTVDIITMYENNIKQHFVEYVERYINIMWKKKEEIKKINNSKKLTEKTKESKIKLFCSKLRKFKDDIFNTTNKNYKSVKSCHSIINKLKKNILPNKIFQKDSVFYDLECSPQDYLPCMIVIMKSIEENEQKINNVFPLRNDIQPKFIKLDTTTIVHLLFNGQEKHPKTFYLTKGNLVKHEDEIWKYFFRIERKCFRKNNYSFHHMVATDGISISILLIRNDMIGKRIPIHKGKQLEKYIDELDNYENLKNKKIVTIDPNLSDILYCVDGINKDRNQFRYTKNQIRKEVKEKKYRNILLDKKKNKKINNKDVIKWETELSNFNRKTLDVNKFKKYIQKKNQINDKLFKFYEEKIFRKLKLYMYINRMRNESKMINNFKKVFGNPENTVVICGDFEQKKGIKYGKEPVKGRGLRNLFRRNKYATYLADEYRTSCRCSQCCSDLGICETFRDCPNPKPWKNNIIKRFGLVKCKTCDLVWNRDENSSCNIYKIAYNAINGLSRPNYLVRELTQ